MITEFRRSSRRFLGCSLLEESIMNFYLQKKQGLLIRNNHTPKGWADLEERDEMGTHSAMEDPGSSVSWPPIMVYPTWALHATRILTVTGKYFANWAVHQLCVFYTSSHCYRQKRIETFSLPKSGLNYEDTVPFSSVSHRLWWGQQWTCLSSHLQ